ncbi:MAG: hypothetical protein COY58_05480 [Gammaproteobacteria bacterium CG_4_10_14_0_8_um_filter_38_16]|nr:MAG: hypothetical protein COY58_05480 [Gammaproteobacteria bacterium CG_4_10_14_0_8_um_filter_38_16]PJA04342.1 MAG: hypothetical protein COX72_00090 [Gammaproteobacteria bacterium CG_4_10_14_0_2_um_filter_38_22]PJB09531.1 MAG: hypothetical protein CO120_09480 [Gammaproteobacteria bacterium CG_4_9_14_3_um_filter_38_9]
MLMKKIRLLILLFLPAMAFAKTIQVQVDNVTSSSGYYSFKLFLYPDDKNHAYAVPTALGAGFLNRYLTGISANDHSYLEFGFYHYFTQQTTWFPNTCKIILNQSSNIDVDIHATACHYTD